MPLESPRTDVCERGAPEGPGLRPRPHQRHPPLGHRVASRPVLRCVVLSRSLAYGLLAVASPPLRPHACLLCRGLRAVQRATTWPRCAPLLWFVGDLLFSLAPPPPAEASSSAPGKPLLYSGPRRGLVSLWALATAGGGGGFHTGTARLLLGKVSTSAVRMSPASSCNWSICPHASPVSDMLSSCTAVPVQFYTGMYLEYV